MAVLGFLLIFGTLIAGSIIAIYYIQQRDLEYKRENDERLLRTAYIDTLSAIRYCSDAFRSTDREFRSSTGAERGLVGVARLRSMDACQKAHSAATSLQQLLASHGVKLPDLPELPLSMTATAALTNRERPKTT
ncbi:hypothetical protein M3Y98_00459300 [Aphelenchoides besseyi]|nr:hypothetical protein M3Y98_00459300 [Aphelenchoides besseyi]KAI6207470.1 hypothetical protein M3Y96_00012300 [Aphelenchoides besseyi]